jgi:hypothetical protein
VAAVQAEDYTAGNAFNSLFQQEDDEFEDGGGGGGGGSSGASLSAVCGECCWRRCGHCGAGDAVVACWAAVASHHSTQSWQGAVMRSTGCRRVATSSQLDLVRAAMQALPLPPSARGPTSLCGIQNQCVSACVLGGHCLQG